MDDAIGKKSFITNDDVTRLSFMTTLIKETLRFYPPAAGVVRSVQRECTIDSLRIPAGTTMIVSIIITYVCIHEINCRVPLFVIPMHKL